MAKSKNTSHEINGKILSFDLLKEGGKVVFTDNVVEAGETTFKKHTVAVERRISEEFRIQLKTLIGHAIYYGGFSNGKLTEKEMKSRKAVDLPEFSDYSLKGFSISGDGEEEKVTIKMTKYSLSGESFSINVPPIPIADGSYLYENLLAADLGEVIKQVKSFIRGENYYVQTSMNLYPKVKEEHAEDDI